MTATVKVLASGLKLLYFQGITTFEDTIVVATVDADLVRVAADGTLTTWLNLGLYGIPSGIVGSHDAIAIAISAQELGHSLIQVTKQGKVSTLADLSILAGEFGAPFAVAAHEGYYPYYLVTISTDVIGSGGLIVRVTPSGKTRVLASLAKTSFGIGIGENYAIATQDNGQVLKIALTGETQVIANLESATLGIPLDITRLQDDWIVTTTTGWLVALTSDGTLFPAVNIAEFGYGLPTTLTTFNGQLVVATQTGNLLQVAINYPLPTKN